MSLIAEITDSWWDSRTVPEPNSGCLLWLGSVVSGGYGVLDTGDGWALAHRVAYERAFGSFDRKLNICHRCDTRLCVNPDHLFAATQLENMRDMKRKGRWRPRWSATKTPTATAVLAAMAATDGEKSGEVVDTVHLIRTVATTPAWCRVVGAPPWPQGHSGPTCEWPQNETDNPETENARLAVAPRAVATVAGCWPLLRLAVAIAPAAFRVPANASPALLSEVAQ